MSPLLTPFLFEPNPEDKIRKTMDEYEAFVKQIAAEAGAVFDSQATFNVVLKELYPAALAWDRFILLSGTYGAGPGVFERNWV
ncbi:hypothetical protein ACE3MQ_05055 [Paenibacillus lentus]